MPLPWPSSDSKDRTKDNSHLRDQNKQATASADTLYQATAKKLEDSKQNGTSTTNSIPAAPVTFVSALSQPNTLLATLFLTSITLGLMAGYRRFARRFPTPVQIPEAYILPEQQRFSRSLFGRVTAVTDADNFRLYHTPLGRLNPLFWLGFRTVPKGSKALRDQTIHVRLAGIDAPELSHFGRPAQPYSEEAMRWLTDYLPAGTRVRVYVHRRDQYGRVVCSAFVKPWWGLGFVSRDVGLEMLKTGLAGIYEAKFGVVFGGNGREQIYRRAEEQAKAKGVGMWGGKGLESPREYKARYRDAGSNPGNG